MSELHDPGSHPMDTEPLKLLLVEDDPADARLVHDMLDVAPHIARIVRHHTELRAAVDELDGSAERPYDVALVDFHLPDSAGLATFERLHAAAPWLPIVVLTNLEDDEVAAQAMREGAQDYLVKRRLEPELVARALRYAVERHRADAALRDSEERYALALAGARDGLFDWNLATGEVYYSPRWEAMLGFEPGEMGRDVECWIERVHEEDRGAFRAKLDAHLAGDSVHFEHEYRLHGADGEARWVLTRALAVRDPNGAATRMAGSLTDIMDRKSTEEQLLHDALHDGLTGLPNRALFSDRLGLLLEHRRDRPESAFAVLFLDLDRFKNVNDSLGHDFGDELLMAIAERLHAGLRPGDTVARLGGDEFALLIRDVEGAAGASRAAERLQGRLSSGFRLGGHEVFASASIGIALSSAGYRRPEEMLRDADIAMYRAKAAGKARHEVFDHEMHRSAVALMRLETDLRRAVERQEFVAHFQPIVSLRYLRIVGFETLTRWNHPQRGLVRPEQFIGVAEETGLIVPLCWWVIEQSCRQIAEWRAKFPAQPELTVSCNISGRLFHAAETVDRLVRILERHRLPPEALRLEITENVLLDHADEVVKRLREVRALGVEIQIDDFGTGYSSLSYLQRFRYDTLKIDRSFIHQLMTPGDGQTIVETILTLGQHLDMNVIAEGIETAEQMRRLQELGCPQGQGYWFARPVPAAAATEMLAGQHP